MGPICVAKSQGWQVLDQVQGGDAPSTLLRGRATRGQRDSVGEGILLFFTPSPGLCPIFPTSVSAPCLNSGKPERFWKIPPTCC